MSETPQPLPERIESHYRDRRVAVPLLSAVLVGVQLVFQTWRFAVATHARTLVFTVFWIFLVFCFAVVVWALIAQRRGYRVVLDRQGIRRDGWPAFSLPWSEIGRVDRLSLRDKGLLMIYRAGKRPKSVAVELKDLDAAYALASAMTRRTSALDPTAFQPSGAVSPLVVADASTPGPAVHSEEPAVRLLPLLLVLAFMAVPVAIPLVAVALMSPHLGPFLLAVGGGLLLLAVLMWAVMWGFAGARTSVVDADATGLRLTTLGRNGKQMSRVDVPWDDISQLRIRTKGRYAEFRMTRRFTGKKALVWGRLDPAVLTAFEELARAHGVPVERVA